MIEVSGHVFHLIRVKSQDKKKTLLLFATNLPLELVHPQMIRKLYRLRWEGVGQTRPVSEDCFTVFKG